MSNKVDPTPDEFRNMMEDFNNQWCSTVGHEGEVSAFTWRTDGSESVISFYGLDLWDDVSHEVDNYQRGSAGPRSVRESVTDAFRNFKNNLLRLDLK